MYNHNKAQQSKNRVHVSWDILYISLILDSIDSNPPYQAADLLLCRSFIILFN